MLPLHVLVTSWFKNAVSNLKLYSNAQQLLIALETFEIFRINQLLRVKFGLDVWFILYINMVDMCVCVQLYIRVSTAWLLPAIFSQMPSPGLSTTVTTIPLTGRCSNTCTRHQCRPKSGAAHPSTRYVHKVDIRTVRKTKQRRWIFTWAIPTEIYCKCSSTYRLRNLLYRVPNILDSYLQDSSP